MRNRLASRWACALAAGLAPSLTHASDEAPNGLDAKGADSPEVRAARSGVDPSELPAWAAEARRATPLTLTGHTFVLPARVDHPFVPNQFTFRQGVGLVGVRGATVDGYDESFDLALVGAVESMRIDAALLPWLGVSGEIGGQLAVGANADSAFFEGARGAWKWELGVVGRAARVESRGLQFATRAFVRGHRGVGVQPGALVAAIVDDREGTVDDILDGGLARHLLVLDRTVVSGAAVSAAYAPAPRVGFIGSVRTSIGAKRLVRFDGATDAAVDLPIATFSAGLAVDVDLRPLPVDVQAEIRTRREADVGRERALEGALASQHFVGAGAFYGARQDVQLGVKGATLLQPSGGSPETWWFGELVLRVFL